jgi:cytidine deaminase
MPDDLDRLFNLARAQCDRAYAPYSRFHVGAAIRTSSGAVFTGCNVENAAYPVGTCAEAGAIAAMVAGGERLIGEIVIAGFAEQGAGDTMVTPCGACRQRIREFSNAATRIHCANAKGICATLTVDALLPASFGPDHLGST